MLLSFTTEHNDVSSANNVTIDSKLSDKSLIKLRKKISPRMEPCGRVALTGNHSDVWPFSSTL